MRERRESGSRNSETLQPLRPVPDRIQTSMQHHRSLLTSISTAAVLGITLAAAAPGIAQENDAALPPFSADTVEAWYAYIAPDPEELKWLEIPWRDSFRSAVRDAQIEGKPILLWAMNGHPMGCV